MRRRLRAFAARVDAEAVLQEALLRAWQAAPRCVPDGQPNGLLRLCLTAARNLATSELRRQRLPTVEIEQLLEQADRAAEEREADPALRQHIADCRQRLPRQPARALAARLDNAGADADAELAVRVGMRRNTFLQNITRARKLLAECLRRAGIDLDLELS